MGNLIEILKGAFLWIPLWESLWSELILGYTHNQLTNISSFPVLFLAIIMMSQVPPNLSFFKIILYLSCTGSMDGSQGGLRMIRSARCSTWVPLGLYPPWYNSFWTCLAGTWLGTW